MATLKEAQAKEFNNLFRWAENNETIWEVFFPRKGKPYAKGEGEEYLNQIIDTLIAQTRTDLLDTLEREIEGKKKEVPTVKVKVGDHTLKEYGDIRVHGKAIGYNQALTDVQDLLEALQDNK